MDVTLHYTEPLVRHAVWRFCWRKVGWIYPIALLVMIVSLGIIIGQGDRSWIIGVHGTILLLAMLVPVLLYRTQRSAALARYRALAGGPASFAATDEMITIRSAGGMAEFPWRTITGIWQYDDCWLLLMGGHFITFPLVGVSSEARAFLAERVLANGGKVA
jgi:YcxB-like protein